MASSPRMVRSKSGKLVSAKKQAHGRKMFKKYLEPSLVCESIKRLRRKGFAVRAPTGFKVKKTCGKMPARRRSRSPRKVRRSRSPTSRNRNFSFF
tara:strand:- start:594 stop:878 length:285 start_codon:yes stop_codon:yes gene_type:complete